MSYLVFARKYRPQVFEDIVGQDHLKRTLANAIASGRVAHAYLFCGPRGVGKTTAARILAKALNCEKGPAPVPCNACRNCVEITEGRSLDVLEIDGASNRGINEVRELRENVRFTPTGGKSKVYIIDEVHMLTQEAFNALLKTLEEPPPHAVFIFATTEPFKVPATILSRCQRFDFARIPSRKIAEHLGQILSREGIEGTPDALALLARRARGGLRDALSLLDQIIAASDGPVDRPSVERFLGLVRGDVPAQLVDLIIAGDAGGALRLLDAAYAEGADLRDLAEELSAYLRDVLLVSVGEEMVPLLETPESEVPALKAQANRLSRETWIELLDRAAELGGALRRSEFPRLTMELALAEMAELPARVPVGEIARRLLELEAKLGGAPAPPASSRREAAPAASPAPRRRESAAAPSPTERETAEPGDDAAARAWETCVEAATAHSRFLGSTLATGIAVGFTGEGALILRPPTPRNLFDERLGDPETQAILRDALARAGVKVPRVVIEGSEGASAAAPSAGTAPAADSAERKAETTGESPRPEVPPDSRSMGELFRDEPMLQKALDMFDGEVLP